MEFNIYRKKVLHIQLLPLLSGVQNAMLNLIIHLNPAEFDYYVICAPNGPLIQRLKELKISYFTIPELKRRINIIDIIVFIKFYYICRKGKFDIVHTHSSKTGFIGRIAAKIAGVDRIIHTVQGFPFHHYQRKIEYIFYKVLEKIASYFCDKMVSVNKNEYEIAVKQNFISSKKITYIHNAVGSNKVDSSKYRKSDFHFSEDDIIIGSVSRFDVPKNNLNLLNTAIKVSKQYNNIHFIFIGDGSKLEVAREIVAKNKLKNRIILPGWKYDIHHWLKLFDIFVLYSFWEGLSLSILEAMSSSLPIIASDIKGNNELIINGINGFLVKIGESETLVDKFIWLATHRTKRLEMGKKSYKFVSEKYNIIKYVESYRKLYLSK